MGMVLQTKPKGRKKMRYHLRAKHVPSITHCWKALGWSCELSVIWGVLSSLASWTGCFGQKCVLVLWPLSVFRNASWKPSHQERGSSFHCLSEKDLHHFFVPSYLQKKYCSGSKLETTESSLSWAFVWDSSLHRSWKKTQSWAVMQSLYGRNWNGGDTRVTERYVELMSNHWTRFQFLSKWYKAYTNLS